MTRHDRVRNSEKEELKSAEAFDGLHGKEKIIEKYIKFWGEYVLGELGIALLVTAILYLELCLEE